MLHQVASTNAAKKPHRDFLLDYTRLGEEEDCQVERDFIKPSASGEISFFMSTSPHDDRPSNRESKHRRRPVPKVGEMAGEGFVFIHDQPQFNDRENLRKCDWPVGIRETW